MISSVPYTHLQSSGDVLHEMFSGKLTVIGDTEKMGSQRTLNLQLSVISLKFGGSLFQAAGPATEKALSPKPVFVLGASKEPDTEDLRVARSCDEDIGKRTFVMYSELRPLTDA